MLQFPNYHHVLAANQPGPTCMERYIKTEPNEQQNVWEQEPEKTFKWFRLHQKSQ
jgi:hypothetical protein